MLEAGIKAPDFTLKDKDENEVSLSDFSGQKVVVYFYPKDSTPGCTRQACAFAADFAAYKEKNIAVIGISKDSTASHRRFAEKNGLPFILLSDPELEAIKAYDVWQEKKMYGKVSMGVVRSSYLIDENGFIELALPKVKPDTNSKEILQFIEG
ncbi:MAG: thioredoxin-dependent thiol peroxidase [Oscillospiraceae bacterium]